MFKKEVNALDQLEAELMLTFFFDKFLQVIPNPMQGGTGYRKLDYYFKCLSRVLSFKTSLRNYILTKNYLITFFDLYNNMESSRFSSHEKAMSPVLMIIAYLLSNIRENIHVNIESK